MDSPVTELYVSAKARHEARPVASRTIPAANSCRNRPSAACGVTSSVFANEAAVTIGARNTASKACGSRNAPRAEQLALLLDFVQAAQFAQADQRRGRHACRNRTIPFAPDAQRKKVMLLLGRRPEGQADRRRKPGFLTPQAGCEKEPGRIVRLDAGMVEPVTGGPAGADQDGPAVDRADGRQPVRDFRSSSSVRQPSDRSVSRSAGGVG